MNSTHSSTSLVPQLNQENGKITIPTHHPIARRLALFMREYNIDQQIIANTLKWSLEKLNTFLSPPDTQTAQNTSISPFIEDAVERMICDHRLRITGTHLSQYTTQPYAPMTSQLIHSQLDMNMENYKSSSSIFTRHHHLALNGSRKRQRSVEYVTVAKLIKTLQQPSDTLAYIPIRLDLSAEDGSTYKETFLYDKNCTYGLSPEVLAAQIARDEGLSVLMRDMIAESIRRQIWTNQYDTMIQIPQVNAKEENRKNSIGGATLIPIYIDLVIDGISIRDQFEWDVQNNSEAIYRFAASFCTDLKMIMPEALNISLEKLQAAVAYSIHDQVHSYKQLWAYSSQVEAFDEVGVQDELNPFLETIPYLPPVSPDEIIRLEAKDQNMWQPIISQLSRGEMQLLESRASITQRPTTAIPNTNNNTTTSKIDVKALKRRIKTIYRENKCPRSINPFIMYCQMQRDIFSKVKGRRTAAESRKILGEMWRNLAEEEKAKYAALADEANIRRRMDHVFDIRDKAIAEWEEAEARRSGLIPESILSTEKELSVDYCRGLLLANYMNERHEVDMNRQTRDNNSKASPR